MYFLKLIFYRIDSWYPICKNYDFKYIKLNIQEMTSLVDDPNLHIAARNERRKG